MDLKQTIKKVLEEQVWSYDTTQTASDTKKPVYKPTEPKKSEEQPTVKKIDVGVVDVSQDLIDAYGIDLVKQAYEKQGFKVTQEGNGLKVTGWALPLPKQYMKSPSGEQKFGVKRGGGRLHDGCDYSAPEGTPIYATKSGKVTYIETADQGLNCGNGVGIRSNNLLTVYCHMKNRPTLSKGQEVSIGQKIGEVGNTGQSDGNHLHIKTKSSSGPFDNWSQIYSQLV